ncbi:hypothetical protein BS78_04G310800 [Paspalum vaginatum]|nr:hypothetical protein BS78_04G310800 [Paspalum vaginatum]
MAYVRPRAATLALDTAGAALLFPFSDATVYSFPPSPNPPPPPASPSPESLASAAYSSRRALLLPLPAPHPPAFAAQPSTLSRLSLGWQQLGSTAVAQSSTGLSPASRTQQMKAYYDKQREACMVSQSSIGGQVMMQGTERRLKLETVEC